MATHSHSSPGRLCDMDGEDPPTPDSKTAKKAIAGVASDIEVLLKNRDDRIEAFVKLHLLEDKNAEDIVRELKRCVGRAPSLFGVLIRELANFPDDDGSKVAEELRSKALRCSECLSLMCVTYVLSLRCVCCCW